MAKPVVAIVGRPNVGKSTLFNRFVGERISIVEDEPNITRDRLYGEASWLDREFLVVDTGGIELYSTDVFKKEVLAQVQLAIDEADVILFLVDARSGLTGEDKEIANILRKSSKEVILVLNKVDDFKSKQPEFWEFYELGLGEPVPVSAEHGKNVGDLLDKVCKLLPESEEDVYAEGVIKLSVIGRPNVGKSSLVNRILGEERVIVSEIPGTTRDAIDIFFTRGDQEFVIIDTAGIRKKKKVKMPVERYSVIRALKAVERSDVCLIIIDATEGVTEQDKKIAGFAHEQGKGMVIVVNKWDLITKDSRTMDRFKEKILYELKFIDYSPITFVSAKTGQRVMEILDIVEFVVEEHTKRVKTGTLNAVIEEALMVNQPPARKGKRLKIYYCTQVGVKPPSFVFFVNDPQLVHFSYRRYLENVLRGAFNFSGTPIWLNFRNKNRQEV